PGVAALRRCGVAHRLAARTSTAQCFGVAEDAGCHTRDRRSQTSSRRRMMKLADVLIAELEREAKSTERILARVPDDKLDWAPHAKSMSLGQLAWHIASLPKSAMTALATGERDVA